MNIFGTSKMKVISRSKTQSKDGQNTYYKLGVLVGSEVGMISCSKEIYDFVENEKTYDFETVYNDGFKSFRLNSVLPTAK